MTKIIIFSDLDGTLLSKKDYSFDSAKAALNQIKKEQIPLILCTSKTYSEVIYYQRLLQIEHPFIIENGGAIYIPKDYFSFSFEYSFEIENYAVIELGLHYKKLIKILKDLKDRTGISIKGFSDMTSEEIAELCHLTQEQAKWAKQRQYDEPFLILESQNSSYVEKTIDLRFYLFKVVFHFCLLYG